MRHVLLLGACHLVAACEHATLRYSGMRYGPRIPAGEVAFSDSLPAGHEVMGTMRSTCEHDPERELDLPNRWYVTADFAAKAASLGGTVLVGFACDDHPSREKCCTAEVARPIERERWEPSSAATSD